MKRLPIGYLTPDALILQSVLSPGEKVTSIRELAYRAFGDTTPDSHARVFKAAVRLSDMGRIAVNTSASSITGITSLDTQARGLQFTAVLHRFVSAPALAA